MERSSRVRTALLTALGVLVALVVVAIASRGSIPAGEGGARGPTQALIDIFFTLYLLGIASSAVMLLYLLLLRRQIAAPGGMDVRRRKPLETLLTVLVFVGVGSLLARRLAGQNPIVPPEPPEQVFGGDPGLATTTSPDTAAYEPEFAWAPAIVTVALIVLALGAWWYAGRARKRARGELRAGESARDRARRGDGRVARRPAGRTRSTPGGDRGVCAAGTRPGEPPAAATASRGAAGVPRADARRPRRSVRRRPDG